jgi:hypothetical protein
MNKIPNRAKALIVAVLLTAVAITVHAILGMHPWHHYQFLSLSVMALVASRLKLKLPGLDGNMSVNLPFVLLAAVQLSPREALAIAAISTMVQCLPARGHKLQTVKVLFNVSTMAIATGMGAFVFHYGSQVRASWLSGSALLVTATATFFLANTVPVASVIALSEGPRMLKVWSSIFHLSFPYYVASAGVTSMVTAATRHVGWQIPLLVLAVMYGIYRCYQLYFGRMLAMARALGVVASDRHSIQGELSSVGTV